LNCICCPSQGLSVASYRIGEDQVRGSLQVRDFGVAHVRIGSAASLSACVRNVRFTSEAAQKQTFADFASANNGHSDETLLFFA
jgi:hypothetical protein